MRFPDTVSAARRWVLAGGAAALLVLLALVVFEIGLRATAGDDADFAESAPAPSQVAPDPYVAPSVAPSPTPTRDPAAGVPEGVRIPAVGVDARVDPVSLEAGGLLEPPGDPSRVGWWRGGARPGSPKGTVVLVGHSVRLGDGVFDDLADLEVGDRVRVATSRGEVAYRVASVVDLHKQDLAAVSPELFSQSGAGRLVLVTCAHWEAGDYRGHTVVIAKP